MRFTSLAVLLVAFVAFAGLGERDAGLPPAGLGKEKASASRRRAVGIATPDVKRFTIPRKGLEGTAYLDPSGETRITLRQVIPADGMARDVVLNCNGNSFADAATIMTFRYEGTPRIVLSKPYDPLELRIMAASWPENSSASAAVESLWDAWEPVVLFRDPVTANWYSYADAMAQDHRTGTFIRDPAGCSASFLD